MKEIVIEINRDIASLVESLKNKSEYLECLEKGREAYRVLLDYQKVESYDRAIRGIRWEMDVLVRLIHERQEEIKSIHFSNAIAA